MTPEEKREKKIEEFMAQHGEQFLLDFPVMFNTELCRKYEISDSFCVLLSTTYHLIKDKEFISQRKAELSVKALSAASVAKSKKCQDSVRQKVHELSILTGRDVLSDFKTLSFSDLMNVYGISYEFCRRVIQEFEIQRDNREIKKRKLVEIRKKYRLSDKEIKSFLQTEGVLEDFHNMSQLNFMEKYSISETVYRRIITTFGIARTVEEINKGRATSLKQQYYSSTIFKQRQTCLERYGATCAANSPRYKDIVRQKLRARKDELVARRQKTFLERYGVTNPCFLTEHPKTVSNLNKEFAEKLQAQGIEVKFEKWLQQKSYDLDLGKLLVELNPTISHSYLVSFGQLTHRFKDKCISRDYHYKKWLTAKQEGYELLSLFDWVDKDKFFAFVISKLGINQTRIGARKLSVKEIDKSTANKFLQANHLLDDCRGNDVNLSLQDSNGAILAVMTFGKPRYSKKEFDFELLRFAMLEGYSIAGGASKLFKHFVSEHPDARIITYSDNNLGNGSVYSILGFAEIGQTGPAIMWCDVNTGFAIKNLSLVRQGADRLLGKHLGDRYFFVGLDRDDFIRRGGKEEYAKEFELHKDEPNWWPTNQDIMLHYKFVPVADCGATIWSYIPEQS